MKPSSFAQIYHAHHERQPEDLPFWLELVAQHPAPVLELGCGTGRVLIPILQASSPVIGLDNDRSMLAALKANTPLALQPGLKLIQADMGAFNFGCRFGLILLPCNTLSTLEPDLRQRMLNRLRNHLLPEGCFAASAPNPQVYLDLPAYGEPEIEEVFPHPQDGEPVQVSSEWKRTKSHFILTWHYDHLQPDGTAFHYHATTRHSLAPPQTYLDELESAGLALQALYGDFDRAHFDQESPHMIIVAGIDG